MPNRFRFEEDPSKLNLYGSPIHGNRYYAAGMPVKFLGYHGRGRILYVLAPPQLYKARNGIFYDPASVIQNSVPIGKASLATQAAVIRHIAYQEVDVRWSLPVMVGPLASPKEYGKTYTKTFRDLRKSPIAQNMLIHPYSDNMKRSQYYDIYLNLVHEKHHADTPEDVLDHDASEYYAHEAVLTHPYFKYASAEYQQFFYHNFDILEGRMLSRR